MQVRFAQLPHRLRTGQGSLGVGRQALVGARGRLPAAIDVCTPFRRGAVAPDTLQQSDVSKLTTGQLPRGAYVICKAGLSNTRTQLGWPAAKWIATSCRRVPTIVDLRHMEGSRWERPPRQEGAHRASTRKGVAPPMRQIGKQLVDELYIHFSALWSLGKV